MQMPKKWAIWLALLLVLVLAGCTRRAPVVPTPAAPPTLPAHMLAQEPGAATPAAPPLSSPPLSTPPLMAQARPAAPSPAPAPVMQTLRVADAVIQRAMAAYVPPPVVQPVSATAVSLVQRDLNGDDTAGSESGALQTAPVDLDAIARDVYPILRRMLQVDRERRTRF